MSQHFKVLREAGLIRSERRGIEMHNTARCDDLDARFPGLIAAIVNAKLVQSRGSATAGNPGRGKASGRKGSKRGS